MVVVKVLAEFAPSSKGADGIEVAHMMIRKGQFSTKDQSAFQQFAALAA
jgi:hypothetical protein